MGISACKQGILRWLYCSSKKVKVNNYWYVGVIFSDPCHTSYSSVAESGHRAFLNCSLLASLILKRLTFLSVQPGAPTWEVIHFYYNWSLFFDSLKMGFQFPWSTATFRKGLLSRKSSRVSYWNEGRDIFFWLGDWSYEVLSAFHVA